MLRGVTTAEPRLPHPVREIAPAWIPMADGTRLAGRLWLPAWASAERPVPALLELIPYRTRDLTALRDEGIHRAFAANGFASARIDIRGSGDSEGLIPDEYLAQELADGAALIAWLAAQPWCTGKVGMFGNSWGGFNALQVAALRPPALGAIVTSCSTDDRFTDDMHYRGGALLTDMLDWGATFLCWMALPPDPAVTGPGWLDAWMARIELAAARPALAEWLRHQERDAFWRHGSVNEDYAAIAVPTLAVGGWQDGYSDAIGRLVAGLAVPVAGVVGPGAHGYPDTAVPGPGIDFLGLALGWWDRWLRDGREGGEQVDGWPALRTFLQEGLPADPGYAVAPGRWIAEPVWPSPRIAAERWRLGAAGGLGRAAGDGGDDPGPIAEVRTGQTVGGAAGEWCPYGTGGNGPELPGDQAADDARSACWESAPLDAPLTILGGALVELAIPPGERPGLVVARLCDVAPDGHATRVTFAIRHARAPGDPGPADGMLTLRMDDTAYTFPAGHRIRLALSTTWWPMVWPEAIPGTLRFHPARSALVLPVRPADPPEAEVPDLGRPWRPPREADVLEPGACARETTPVPGGLCHVNTVDGGLVRVRSTGVAYRATARDTATIRDDDPSSAAVVAERSVRLVHPGGEDLEVRAEARLSADAGAWHLSGRLLATRAGTTVADRSFATAIRRRIP